MKPMQPLAPMRPLDSGPAWWPAELGHPAASGEQDGLAYAVFPSKRRLAVRRAERVTVYDSAEHAIGGVAQGGADPVFSTAVGSVALDSLQEV